jgi:hypothetical protein
MNDVGYHTFLDQVIKEVLLGSVNNVYIIHYYEQYQQNKILRNQIHTRS